MVIFNLKNYSPLIFSLMLLVLLFHSSCSQERLSLQEQYQSAIIDAMTADENEISSNLIAITDRNDYLIRSDSLLLVGTFTKYPDSYITGDTIFNEWGDIWVTVVPEINDWSKDHNIDKDTLLRIEQLLGLPPHDGYSHIVELWVKPTDLFRPAPDNEITDSVCELEFPAGTDSSYIFWFQENAEYSYSPMRYPWTRLGYTYDWGSENSEIGLSEFVIRKNSMLIVKSNQPCSEYLHK